MATTPSNPLPTCSPNNFLLNKFPNNNSSSSSSSSSPQGVNLTPEQIQQQILLMQHQMMLLSQQQQLIQMGHIQQPPASSPNQIQTDSPQKQNPDVYKQFELAD